MVINCTDSVHWWRRTPPVPFEPAGFTADDARCLCGKYLYSQYMALADAGTTVGTFVDEVIAVPRCDQCRFWTRRELDLVLEEPSWVNEKDDSPERRAEYIRWGTCALTEMTGAGVPREAKTLAMADDHGEYRTFLITAESFGCVQFERKA